MGAEMVVCRGFVDQSGTGSGCLARFGLRRSCCCSLMAILIRSRVRSISLFGLTACFGLVTDCRAPISLYCTERYRPLLREQPIRFVVLPVLITAGCFALFLPADSALPWTREERLIGLAIIDYACVTYHFAAQHFGALSLYRSRAGSRLCIQTRRWDRFFALGAGGVLVFVADILSWSSRLSRSVGRSLVSGVDCIS